MYKFLSLTIALTLSTSTFAADANKGKQIFKEVNCAMCHNADGMGKAKNGKLSILKAPRIAGLEQEYIIAQMTAIQSKTRKTKYTSMMYSKIKKLTKEDISHVAAYVTALSKDKFKGMNE